MAGTIYVTRGLPASGKSTWAKTWLAEDTANRVRVNRDDIRTMLGCWPIGTPEQEDNVTVIEESAVAAAVAAGRDVVVDATHLKADRVRRWYSVSPEVTVVDFPVPPEECGRRDAERKRQGLPGVGRDVIFSMAKQYHIKADGRLPKVPQPTSKDRPVFAPYVGNPDLPSTYIFDVDGTLANHGDRHPFDFDRAGEDSVHEHVAELLRLLARKGYAIVIVTGRSSDRYDQLIDWLDRAGLDHHVDDIFMRAAGDKRNDAIVKAEILHRDIAPKYNVIATFDDRDRVVNAWRAMGIPCFQVAPGNF